MTCIVCLSAKVMDDARAFHMKHVRLLAGNELNNTDRISCEWGGECLFGHYLAV